MFKHADYKGTYCAADAGNVRYPSSAEGAEEGWAYAFTKDAEYVYGLSQYHTVQVREDGKWIPYAGYLPNADDLVIGPEQPLDDDDADRDADY